MQLKDILCQIDSNADELHGGLVLSKPVLWKLQFGTNVLSGEEESIPLFWVASGPTQRQSGTNIAATFADGLMPSPEHYFLKTCGRL